MTINYQNLEKIKSLIANFTETQLLIVTKKQSIEDILELINNGQYRFGENRVQEAKSKYVNLRAQNNFSLHLIGPLQTNKTEEALKLFDVIQTVDRIKLVDEISKNLVNKSELRTNEFFIQVNIGNEEQKSGVHKGNLRELYEYSISKKLNIKGLMCIPPNIADPTKYFREMVVLRDNLNRGLKLSMGMSADYEYALNNQSNIIRIGSFIFQ